MRFRYAIFATLFLPLVLGVGMLATPPQSEPMLSIDTPTPVIASGGCLQIRITLRNTTSRKIGIGAPPRSTWPAEAVYRINLTTLNGAAVPRTAYGHGVWGGSRIAVYVEPGGVLRKELFLARLYDITMPGEYAVEASLPLPGGGLVTSNRLIITVTAP